MPTDRHAATGTCELGKNHLRNDALRHKARFRRGHVFFETRRRAARQVRHRSGFANRILTLRVDAKRAVCHARDDCFALKNAGKEAPLS